MIAIAIDDEPIALDIVKSHASKVPFITLEAVFTNAFEAIAHLQQHQVDLIFLDIKMPDISGIDFLGSLSNPPLVIFTTAYAEHAVKGFELNALDYLLKPFSLSRFLKACNKAEELYSLRKKSGGIVSAPEHFFIKDGYEQVKVIVDHILYIEAAGNYTLIHLNNNSSLSTRMPIGDMQLLLPVRRFVRTHRAFIVAKNAVTRFDKNQIRIGDKIIPVGSTYAQCLQEF
ncbi:two component transcriptional regulator, LytTR family [Pedobacter westerhofensis]|uniref:Two component transcriptional regulator, LytTR family n=1 Tax=Pedobacter westerhofensis TaxID=425512 RepID=A0A521DDT2_9SPHI|nr:response regulator transcription factor [Pedobacter westerhofensis]SMO69887.1 two component transcriptional regulator, LytTR family [Pedobacter westerhofensis]